MLYIFENAIDRESHQPTERAVRRKGAEVNIERVSLGLPLVVEYTDGSGTLLTSRVTSYPTGWKDVTNLAVQTMNTVYTFRKVSE